MNVVAGMAYYHDDLELLDKCLRSIPVVADKLVVVDGRYERYLPGEPAGSPKEHLDFIRTTCAEIGLPLKLEQARRPWQGQIAKRCRLVELATRGLDWQNDWFVGIDADHIFHGVRYSVRAELERIDQMFPTVEAMYWTPMNWERDLLVSAAGEWHAALANDYTVVNTFYRAWPGLRLEQRHWWFSAINDGIRFWVSGGDSRYPHARIAPPLKAPFTVEHACLFRKEHHIVANREFCQDRVLILQQTGQEDAPVVVAA